MDPHDNRIKDMIEADSSDSSSSDSRNSPKENENKNRVNIKRNVIGLFNQTIKQKTKIEKHYNILPGSQNNSQDLVSIIYGIPIARETMIGRETEKKELYDLIMSSQHVLITGTGGVGKTSLAVDCAHDWYSESSNSIRSIVFLNAENIETFKQSLDGLAKELGVEYKKRKILEIIRNIYNRFNKEDHSIFIYDNIDIESLEILNNYLPDRSSAYIHVLGTSQNTNLDNFFTPYSLEMLPVEDAISLFKEGLTPKYVNEKDELFQNNIKRVVELLACLPIAIVQGAAYIRNILQTTRRQKINSAIDDYIKNVTKYLDRDLPLNFKNSYGKNVFACLQINITKIQDECAKTILRCMAYMNPTGIDEEIFHHFYSEEEVNVAVQSLINYSIIKETRIIVWSGEADRLSIHRLIQEVCRILEKEQRETYLKLVFKLIIKTDRYDQIDNSLFKIEEKALVAYYLEETKEPDFQNELKDRLTTIDCDLSLLETWNAIHHAAYLYQWHILKALMHQSDAGYFKTKDNWTVLHSIALAENDFIAYEDLSKSIIIDTRSILGLAPLHIVSALDNWYIVIQLIKHRCNISLRDDIGNTAAHWAARHGHTRIIELLVDCGVVVDLKNNYDKTICDYLNERVNTINLKNQTQVKSIFVGNIIRFNTPSGESINKFVSWDLLPNTSNGMELLKHKWLKLWQQNETNKEVMSIWWQYETKSMITNNSKLHQEQDENGDIHKLKHKLSRISINNSWDIWWRQTEPLLPTFLELLSNCPLALDIATSYITTQKISIQQCIDKLTEDTNHPELDIVMNSCSDKRYKYIYKVICLVIDTIKEKHTSVFTFLNFAVYWGSGASISDLCNYICISAEDSDQCVEILYEYSILESRTHIIIPELVQSIVRVYIENTCEVLANILNFQCEYNPYSTSVLDYMGVKDIRIYYEKLYEDEDKKQRVIAGLKKSGFDISSLDGWQALHYACADARPRSWTVLERLIFLQVDVNEAINGITPLVIVKILDSLCKKDKYTMLKNAGAKSTTNR